MRLYSSKGTPDSAVSSFKPIKIMVRPIPTLSEDPKNLVHHIEANLSNTNPANPMESFDKIDP